MFIYDKALKQILEDELLILENTVNWEPNYFKEIKDKWQKDNDIANFKKWIDTYFPETKVKLISESTDNNQDLNDLFLIRLEVLLSVISEFEDFYQKPKPKSRVFDHVDEFGVDLKIRDTFYELAKTYVDYFIEQLKQLDTIKEFDFFYEGFLKALKKVKKAQSITDSIDKIYSIEEILSDFVDAVEEKDFELLPSEVQDANEFLNFMIFCQTIIYYLILIYETLEFLELKKIGIFDYENKLYYSERNDELEMIKTINK
ncbi:hypothetical protein [Mycoplasma putrefaciens]|uniref:Uncharacterized protein n=1 Tax=Mycoplasma putrefaciens Mput9231 TaxID=1292033 RepID=M9WGK6_9MOLU|nr:hypothetical protein [Mycoplasma putrefaciens]AGJ90580.1 Hypothetical protein MPUT9231_1410 [Mycoplasma putrefaciens Mput9231]